MKIVFRCRCRQKLAVKEKYSGKTVTCPNCNQEIDAPELVDTSTTKPPSDSEVLPPKSLPMEPHSVESESPARRFSTPETPTGLHIPFPAVIAGVVSLLMGIGHILVALFFLFQQLQMLNRMFKHSLRRNSMGMFDMMASQVGFSMIYSGAVLLVGVSLVLGTIGLFRFGTRGWILSAVNSGLTIALSLLFLYWSIAACYAAWVLESAASNVPRIFGGFVLGIGGMTFLYVTATTVFTILVYDRRVLDFYCRPHQTPNLYRAKRTRTGR